jgi:hypothetical protein
MTENIEPTFTREDEALLASVAMSPGTWIDSWTAIDSRPEVDTVAAEKLAGKTPGLAGMQIAIAARLGPAVEIPPQPRLHELPPRLQAESIRRRLQNPAIWR